MADWSLPGLSNTYSDFIAMLKQRDTDAAVGFDPAYVSPTNLPTNAIRWNSANKMWERWSGSAWAALCADYAITVNNADKLGGTAATSYALQSWVSQNYAALNGSTGQNFSANNLYFNGAIYGPYATNGRSPGDIVACRSGGLTGVLYLDNTGSHFLYWDGTNYNMPGGQLYINSNQAWHAGNLNPANYVTKPGGASGYNGVQGLLRSDAAADNYNVQSWWDGAYWYLKGYNSTTYHAPVRVGDADLVAGYAVNTSGVNNVANQVARTDSNGYFNTGWINTVSGDMGTSAVGSAGRVYCSNDQYIRFKTMANFGAEVTSYLGTVANATNASQLGGEAASTHVHREAKAWVNFGGSGGATIHDSHNVSSMTRNGTGDYTVNLSTAIANAYGVPVMQGSINNTTTPTGQLGFSSYMISASQARFASFNSNTGGFTDVTYGSAVIFGS